jgi:hypothetical protein
MDLHKKGGELDQKHINDLMDQTVRQLEFHVNDCLRHAVAHLGVDHDHPSKAVVGKELVERLKVYLNGLEYEYSSEHTG